MIALGLTWAEAPGISSLILQNTGAFSVVAAHCATASTPQNRLRLQTEAARALTSFLPFSTQHAPIVADAIAWATGRHGEIHQRLSALQNRCQMVIDLSVTAPDQNCLPRDWLRQRAQRLVIARMFRDCLAPLTDEVQIRINPQGARLDILLGKGDQRRFAQAVNEHDRDARFSGWSALATGPWPALSFHGLEPT